MLTLRANKDMGRSDQGWLKSSFHFSFAEYHNPDNLHFGVLRVLNDDIIQPKSGFPTHPHRDMEIITYIISGELTHKDSMGNEETLTNGDVQYMSAGTGVTHSEYNLHPEHTLRLLQIWIYPPQKSLTPIYGSHRFDVSEMHNRLLHIVSSQQGNAKIQIYQDVNLYVSKLDRSKKIEFPLSPDKQIYFVQIEGTSTINGVNIEAADAMEIVNEASLSIDAVTDSHFLFIEMPKS